MRIVNGINCDSKILEIVRYSKFFKHNISLPNINKAYVAPGTYNHYVYNKENYKQFDSLASRVFDAAREQGMEWLFLTLFSPEFFYSTSCNNENCHNKEKNCLLKFDDLFLCVFNLLILALCYNLFYVTKQFPQMRTNANTEHKVWNLCANKTKLY